MAHEFNASNEEGTCLWCGDKLKPNYDSDRVDGPRKPVEDDMGHIWSMPTVRLVNKVITGYGWENNGFFCTLRCGEAFGKAFARLGRRLQPLQSKEK